MARSIRLPLAGGCHQVMARGHRREAIFRDDDDHRLLLRTLAQACQRTGWLVHAWARLLWGGRTTVSRDWIARELGMRCAANVSQQLRRPEEGELARRVPPRLRRFWKSVDEG